MLIDARFIMFVPVELLLEGIRAGFMPQWRELLYIARGAELRHTPSRRRLELIVSSLDWLSHLLPFPGASQCVGINAPGRCFPAVPWASEAKRQGNS